MIIAIGMSCNPSNVNVKIVYAYKQYGLCKNIQFCFAATVVKFNNSIEFLAITTESCSIIVWRSDFNCRLKCRLVPVKRTTVETRDS